MIRFFKNIFVKIGSCILSSQEQSSDSNTEKNGASKGKTVHWKNDIEKHYIDVSNNDIFERDVEAITQGCENGELNNILDYNIDLEFSNVSELSDLSNDESEESRENVEEKIENIVNEEIPKIIENVEENVQENVQENVEENVQENVENIEEKIEKIENIVNEENIENGEKEEEKIEIIENTEIYA